MKILYTSVFSKSTYLELKFTLNIIQLNDDQGHINHGFFHTFSLTVKNVKKRESKTRYKQERGDEYTALSLGAQQERYSAGNPDLT